MTELNTIKTLDRQPFKNLVATIGNLPTSFVDSMSYYEMLAWLCNYIEEQIIPTVNSYSEAIVELQELYAELKEYVDNYFENLDVQEEINNKLDDMAEQGQLADIIAQYLQLAGVLAFNTVSDMQSATNISNGSTARTLGFSNYLDGKGAFYKIRDITNDDTIDGVNIIEITADPTNTLIAELIPDDTRKYVGNLVNKNYHNMILIGDSYCEENTDHDITKFFWQVLRDNLGLTQNVNFHENYQSGAGFGNQEFIAKLQELSSSITNKDEITEILVCGGWNDSDTSQTYGTDEAFNAGILAFNNYVKANYPNAKVTIAHISWGNPNVSNDYLTIYDQMPVSIRRYKQACDLYGWNYLNGTEYILHIYDSTYWETDGNHPSQNGQTLLGNELTRAFINGSIETYRLSTVPIAASGNAEATNINTIYSELNNDNCRLWYAKTYQGVYFKVNETATPTMNCDGVHEYELATFSSKDIIGHDPFVIQGIPLYITGSHDGLAASTYMGFGDLIVKNSKLCLRPTLFDGGQRQENINVNYIWIPNISISAPSLDS